MFSFYGDGLDMKLIDFEKKPNQGMYTCCSAEHILLRFSDISLA